MVEFSPASNNKLAVRGRPGSDSRPMQLFYYAVFEEFFNFFTAEFLGVHKPSIQTLICAVTNVCGRSAYFIRNILVGQAK